VNDLKEVLQHVPSFLLVDFTDITELMISGGCFEKLPAVVTDTRLAKLELKKRFAIIR